MNTILELTEENERAFRYKMEQRNKKKTLFLILKTLKPGTSQYKNCCREIARVTYALERGDIKDASEY